MGMKRLELGSFEEVRKGVPLKYRITTVSEELVEPVIDHMTTAFLPREPMFSHHRQFSITK